MPQPRVSLCTYTYNDGHYVDGLLAGLSKWTVRPDEIVIVDDGSEPPYRPPERFKRTRLIRFHENKGITQAKSAGISSATGKYIMSIDCDVQVVPDWLEICLPHALRKEIGLVAGPVEYASGRDSVSRYLSIFGDNHNLNAHGLVEFIPGNAQLMRRETWEKIQGFGGHKRPVCEDHALCNRLKRANYILFCDSRAVARQVRRLNRRAMAKRVWSWCHAAAKRELPDQTQAAQFLFARYVMPMLDRIKVAVEREELIFLYLEILYMNHVFLDLLEYGRKNNLMDEPFCRGFFQAVEEYFKDTPKFAYFLKTDLLRLGHSNLLKGHGDLGEWTEILSVLDPLKQSGVFKWLEDSGIQILDNEERAGLYDFSAYEFGKDEAVPRSETNNKTG